MGCLLDKIKSKLKPKESKQAKEVVNALLGKKKNIALDQSKRKQVAWR